MRRITFVYCAYARSYSRNVYLVQHSLFVHVCLILADWGSSWWAYTISWWYLGQLHRAKSLRHLVIRVLNRCVRFVDFGFEG